MTNRPAIFFTLPFLLWLQSFGQNIVLSLRSGLRSGFQQRKF